uniref:Short-chain dehydrogenase/reductase 3 n=1 Tax=Culicoides sonorensis TaxID=179676 RepID=A0A336MY90_CULSO
MIDVNVMSLVWTTRVFLQDFIEQKRGHIVTISSIAGLFGAPDLHLYTTTKFAVRGFMESTRKVAKRVIEGIKFNERIVTIPSIAYIFGYKIQIPMILYKMYIRHMTRLGRIRDEKFLAESRKEESRMWIDMALLLPNFVILIIRSIIEFFIPKPFKDVRGQLALITGGANGIGRQIAINLAKQGCKIAIVDIDYDGAKKTANELTTSLGVKAKAFKADVSKSEDIEKLKLEVKHDMGVVDILINNAGVFFCKSPEEETPSNLQKMIDINLMANFWTTRCFLQDMIDQKRGHIVSISSFAGLVGIPSCICYTASKFGVRGFMEGLTIDLHYRKLGEFIKTTTIFPYFVDTNPGIKVRVIDQCEHKIMYDPIMVGSRIVEGILRNEEVITFPKMTYFFCYLFTSQEEERRRDEALLAASRGEEFRMWIDLTKTFFKAFLLLLKTIYEFFVPRKFKDVSGQVAFITGAAKGLGKEIAINLAKKKCNIAVVDIDFENAKKTAEELKELGVKAKAFKADVSKAEEIDALKGPVEESLGPVDIVINNAGVFFTKNIEDETPENLQRMININLMSSFWTIRTFLQGMVDRQRGHIAAVSSFAGLNGLPQAVCYTASKFGLRGLIEGLSIDLHHRNINCINTTCIFPYFIDTNPAIKEIVKEGTYRKVILDPIKSGKTIVEGILRNEEIVTLPRNTYYLSYLLSFPMGLKKMCNKTITVDGYRGTLNKQKN